MPATPSQPLPLPLPTAAAPAPRRLDVRGQFCPLPVLFSVREIRRLQVGETLEVVGDDPGMLEDMPVWCERAGHRLLTLEERDGEVRCLIEKGVPRLRTLDAP